ncbi:Apc15p protein-domain-containing protein [Hypoxylon rubiginosum]|uniref:Apc15p protein-domain-containing protein n=1 Tax=Hypoxylon rubiginosum TaxID=110542 RepID=A0ACB9ZG53_9PEZI|nr:Apc15p protein-domain-containing protein [Hypoxylon rubiginosum]
MFSLLPDLTPRDSHTLWYTSSRNPLSSPSYHGGSSSGDAYLSNQHNQQHQHQHDNNPNAAGANGQQQRRGGAHLIERSLLARLRADELNLERRRRNVALFGSTWLRPVGVPKSLHQMREERREAEEHQEALRREQLAQELAEAEAGGAGAGVDTALGDAPAAGAGPGGVDDDGAMDDVQLDGARDLDDDIPEADADFGIGSSSDEDEDEDEDEEDDEDEAGADDPEQRAAQAQQQLMQQRMRQADDAFRESMARGRDSTHYYGVDDEVDDEDQAQMIEEDDLVGHGDEGGDLDMGADLDDDIPEAEDEGYEHTDSEAELSSEDGDEDDEDHVEMSFAAQASQARPPRRSHARSDATRNSLAISDLLSHDGSSMLGSSPEALRRASGVRRFRE